MKDNKNWKEKSYVIKTVDGQPKITVCLIWNKENNEIARGISVCSDQDQWVSGEGLIIARENAIRALKRRRIDPIKKWEIIKILIRTRAPFTKKAELFPELSFFEIKLLFGKNCIEKYGKVNQKCNKERVITFYLNGKRPDSDYTLRA